MDTATVSRRHDEDTLAWRTLRFLRAGACPAVAELLAASSVDTNDFERLVRIGCTADQAARILR